MSLIEKYLRAVAAQLPPATRDDIVAELRDELMTRMEAREAELGRPLTEAEQEAVLREMGHPLSVAARFGAGPQHVVGPELYPWWLFGVKTALAVMIVITLAGAVARVLTGDADVGQAIGQGFGHAFWNGMAIVGLATAAGFIIERQKERPAFLTQWRARDLGLFELGLFGGWADGFDGSMRGGAMKDGARKAGAPAGEAKLSPTAGAMGSAVGWGVFLLWWTGFLGVGFRPEDLGGRLVSGGVDYGDLVRELAILAYWPVLAFAAARGSFHLLRAATGSPVRFTALGDAAFSAVSLGFIGWFWLYSPFAPLIRVDTVQDFAERIGAMIQAGQGMPATIIMASTVLAFAMEVLTLLGALKRLAVGR